MSKVYPNGMRAVSVLDLEVEDGEFMVLVGPSGCGKTTALRMVAGLEAISEGELSIGGQVVNFVEPRRRDVAMVFQNYALYPHMTIGENITFPLRSRGIAKTEIRERLERTAAMLGLQELLNRRPRTLSGGQRQRVAMGRAIIREPQVFLMDEPLSNLDAKLRAQMRAEISTLQRELRVTTIYVTHDQVEAMTMGSRIAVMRKGLLQQVGAPEELYDSPTNLFVATFIGSPGMNLFSGEIETVSDGVICTVGKHRLPISRVTLAKHPTLASYRGRSIALGVRPENVAVVAAPQEGQVTIAGTVRLVETLGSEQLIHVNVEATPVLTDEILEIASDIDAATVQSLESEASEHLVPAVARVGRQEKAEEGAAVRLALDIDFLHFFDLDSGKAIL